VEAVAKLYFPKIGLPEFINGLRNVLRIELHECSQPEAEAFIRFFKLDVTSLKGNTMIRLEDLSRYFPQLTYMFRHALSERSVVESATNNGIDSMAPWSLGTKRLASPSNSIQVVLNNNSSSEVISLDSGPPTPVDGPSTAKRRSELKLNGKKVHDEVDGGSHVQRMKQTGKQVDLEFNFLVLA
jgi:hypothetical protein